MRRIRLKNYLREWRKVVEHEESSRSPPTFVFSHLKEERERERERERAPREEEPS